MIQVYRLRYDERTTSWIIQVAWCCQDSETDGTDKECMQKFGGETSWGTSTWKTKMKQENNITMDLREV